MASRIRQTDMLFRLGGDEFVLLCPNTDLDGITKLMDNIKDEIIDLVTLVASGFGFSYGFSSFAQDLNYGFAMKRADDNLYKMKLLKKKAK
jgi:diguanylate cyclase (GGDEF)-like protein